MVDSHALIAIPAPPIGDLAPHGPASRATLAAPRTATRLLQSRVAVVGILLCAGPIGLPALWLSPRFSTKSKTCGTIAYFVMTAILPLVLAWYWLDFALRPLVDALDHSR